MRKIVVYSMITLDGVMQSPGDRKEDVSGGFKYGGWVAPFSDDVYNKQVQKDLQPADYLLGRKTYEIWAAYWPQHADFWPGINDGNKYLFSKSIKKTDPLVTGWKNASVIKNLADIKKLKTLPVPPNRKGPNSAEIQVWGSSKLIHLLLRHGLVDELKLKIHPLVLGRGKKLFDEGIIPGAFSLVKSTVTPGGVIIANYQRAGEVKTGSVKA